MGRLIHGTERERESKVALGANVVASGPFVCYNLARARTSAPFLCPSGKGKGGP